MSSLVEPRTRSSRTVALLSALALVAVMFPTAADASGGGGYLTSADPLIVLDPSVSNGRVIPIINSGDALGSFVFEGLPDGIGLTQGRERKTVDVYVGHGPRASGTAHNVWDKGDLYILLKKLPPRDR